MTEVMQVHKFDEDDDEDDRFDDDEKIMIVKGQENISGSGDHYFRFHFFSRTC